MSTLFLRLVKTTVINGRVYADTDEKAPIQINRAFIPADEDTLARTRERTTGEVFRGEFKLSRNYKFLQKAHVLIKYAFDLQEQFDNIKHFREAVTIEAGFFTWKKLLDGSEIKVAKSWAFDNMSEDEFSELFVAMINALVKHSEMFGGAEPDVFEAGVYRFMDNWSE